MARRTKHTHTGECQVCGAHHAISTGDERQWIAKHGYTREDGFFNGTCWGSDAQPLELSKDLLDEAIRRVEVQREDQKRYRLSVLAMAGTTKGWHDVPVPKEHRLYGYLDELHLYGEFFEVWTLFANQKDGYNKVMFRCVDEHNKLNGTEHDPRGRGHIYSSALEAGKISQERKIRSIDGTIVRSTQYIEWQLERKKKWKVQKLKPVKHEPPRPVLEKGMTVEIPGRDLRYVLAKAKHALSWGGSGRNPRVVGWFAEAENDSARRFYLTNKDLKTAKVVSKGGK